MAQKNLKRTLFQAKVNVLNLKNDDKQDVDFTGYFEVGDTVDFIDEGPNGFTVLVDNLTILAIDDNQKFVVFDQVIDTTLATQNAKFTVQTIDDGHEAVDRLYRRIFRGAVGFNLSQSILDRKLNTPIVGQTTLFVEDTSFWQIGDTVDILADEGIIATNVTVTDVKVNADDINNRSHIAVAANVDTNLFTNPVIINTTINMESAVKRLQAVIDGIDHPVKNVYLGLGDNFHSVFKLPEAVVPGSTIVTLDGSRSLKGTAGTRATLIQGTGNSALTFTSMITGINGNKTTVEVVAGTGLVINVGGSFKNGMTISITNNGGAATALDIANALNNDLVTQRIIQVQYGGTGLGVITPFGPFNLTGGLDDWTLDYAELEQIYENNITGTGFKWISFNINKNIKNRMKGPPEDDEELMVDYTRAASNVNR